MKLLLVDHVGGVKVFVPDSTKDSAANRAEAYADVLKSIVPLANGFPQFDLVVLGMGKDGHVGSLYPGRPEVSSTDAWVLPVDKVAFVTNFLKSLVF